MEESWIVRYGYGHVEVYLHRYGDGPDPRGWYWGTCGRVPHKGQGGPYGSRESAIRAALAHMRGAVTSGQAQSR